MNIPTEFCDHRIPGVKGKINISIKGFCLGKDNIYPFSSLVSGGTIKDPNYRSHAHFSIKTPPVEDLEKCLRAWSKKNNINLPEKMKSPAELFEKKLLAHQ